MNFFVINEQKIAARNPKDAILNYVFFNKEIAQRLQKLDIKQLHETFSVFDEKNRETRFDVSLRRNQLLIKRIQNETEDGSVKTINVRAETYLTCEIDLPKFTAAIKAGRGLWPSKSPEDAFNDILEQHLNGLIDIEDPSYHIDQLGSTGSLGIKIIYYDATITSSEEV